MKKLFTFLAVLAVCLVVLGCSSTPRLNLDEPTPFEGTWVRGDRVTWTFTGNQLRILDYENGMAVDGTFIYENGRITYFNEWVCLKLSNSVTPSRRNREFFENAIAEYSNNYRKVPLTREDFDFSYRYPPGFEDRLDQYLENLNSTPFYDGSGIKVGAEGAPGSKSLGYTLKENSLVVVHIPWTSEYTPYHFDPAFEGEFVRLEK